MEYLGIFEKLEKFFMRVLICFIYFFLVIYKISFLKYYNVIIFRKNILKNILLIVNICIIDFYIFREKIKNKYKCILFIC